jgi:hypothetical protein
MADMDYFGAEYDGSTLSSRATARPRRRMRATGLMNWAGAATSLGLIGVTGAWAVDIALRDVTDVPVIRAAEGPMRVAPEDPGGETAPYQGLALSDITSGGAAAPSPEQIALAPAPVELAAPPMSERAARVAELEAPAAQPATEEGPRDALAASVGAESLTLPGPLTPPDAGLGVDVAMLDTAADRRPGSRDDGPVNDAAPGVRDMKADVAEILAQLAAEAGRPADKLGGLGTSAPEDQAGAAETPETEGAATGPFVRASYRPAKRPAVWRAAARADATPAAPAAGPGTPVAQVGAFESEAGARAEWERLSGLFAPLLADKQRLIDRADGDGRSFYRLRVVGFERTADAREFCDALLEGRAACLPVTLR